MRKCMQQWRWCLALLMLAAMSLPARASDGPISLSQVELADLADTGQFDQLLNILKLDHDRRDTPQVTALIDSIETYQLREKERDSKRHEDHDKALAKMVELADQGKLDEALYKAVDAHAQALEPEAMLASDPVAALIHRSEAAAAQAEKEHDWLEALTLYRALDLLVDDRQAGYYDKVKQAVEHIRIIRMYVPAELERLYALRAKRQDKQQEPIHLGDETWQQRVEGITPEQLYEAFSQADGRYVDRTDYETLLTGGINAMLMFLDTQALSQAFPTLGDADRMQAFRRHLLAQREQIKQSGLPISKQKMTNIIDGIFKMNRGTVALPQSVLIYEIAQGGMGQLDDFSTVIWPYDFDQFRRNTQGEFYGVGIQITIRNDQLSVVTPLANTPARQAGIRAKDVIARVDGKPTAAWTLDQAVREITGPPNTKVTLTIERDQGEGVIETFDVPLTRAEIPIESIKGWQSDDDGRWNYYIDPQLGIGYVRLTQFIPQTADDLDAAINDMQAKGGVNGLILDLRFNPGGLLTQSVAVVDRFITSGRIVATCDGDLVTRGRPYRARRDNTYEDFPLVVLINQGSASASEIVSGALQDHHRATIVGTRSYGKGSVQDLYPIAHDGRQAYLKLTTQYYQLPGQAGSGGRIIHRRTDSKTWGIEPDVQVEMTSQEVADAIEYRQDADVLPAPDQRGAKDQPQRPLAIGILEKGLDPQLEVALLVMKTKLLENELAGVRRAQAK